MRLSSSNDPSKLPTREPVKISPARMTAPFSKVIKSLQLNNPLKKVTNRELRKSQEMYVPGGIKSYDDNILQELTVRSKGKSDDYKQRYLSVLTINPQAFHKSLGEFTLYSDCSVRVNRVGPYNRKK